MKLLNKDLAGHKLAVAGAVLAVDADGYVTTEDEAQQKQLMQVGFKAPFRKTPEPVKAEPTTPVVGKSEEAVPAVESKFAGKSFDKKGKR